ncbi:hypothetical protein BH18ACT9_BH18ACT9_06820 [soil metagenome]
MKYSYQLNYAAAPDEVYAMLSDPAFREKVCAAGGATRHDVAVTSTGDQLTVVVDQTQPATGIPSFAQKLVGDEINVVQTERWSRAGTAALDVAIPGKPVHLKGTITLTGTVTGGGNGGTVQSVQGDLKVNIPMLGAKLERPIADVLTTALRNEERIGRVWLAAAGG